MPTGRRRIRMKHILPIRGPNPKKIFGILIALCFVAFCAPAFAGVNHPANNNMIPAGGSNLAVSDTNSADISGQALCFNCDYDCVLNLAAATPAGNINTDTAYLKEGNARATNSTWRSSRLNAANENLRPLYLKTTMACEFAIIPRQTTIPFLN